MKQKKPEESEQSKDDVLSELPPEIRQAAEELYRPAHILRVAIHLANLTGELDMAIRETIKDFEGAELAAMDTGHDLNEVLEFLVEGREPHEEEYVPPLAQEIFCSVCRKHANEPDSELSWCGFVEAAKNDEDVKRLLLKNPSFGLKALNIIAMAFANTQVMGEDAYEPDSDQAQVIDAYTGLFYRIAEDNLGQQRNRNDEDNK